jgi:acyl-CoA thioester hydrolase
VPAVKDIVPPTDKRGEIMSWENYRHRCQVRVRFGDTDPYGIVYFVSYFRYCHRAIEEFLRSLGLPPEETFRNLKEGFGLPIVEAHGKFIRPSRYGDLLDIETSLQELRDKAIIFRFRFFPAGRDKLIAEGNASLVAISREWQAIPLPEQVRHRLTSAGQSADGSRERG